MSEFIKVLLSLSLSGTLLMLLVLLPKPLYREQFSRRWQYYIWLIVALRFLLPVTPDSTFTGYLFARMESALLPGIAENDPGSGKTLSVSGSNPVTGSPYNTDSAPEAGETIENRQVSVRAAESDNSPSLPDDRAPGLPHPGLLLFGIWLTGATILIIRRVTLYQSFLHFLKAGNRQVSDIETLNLLAGCAERLNVKKSS